MTRNYASTHRGRTTVRVREMLLGNLVAGREIQLAIVREAVLAINSPLIAADLTQQDTRLLIENAALAVARRDGDRIHNRLRRDSGLGPIGKPEAVVTAATAPRTDGSLLDHVRPGAGPDSPAAR